MEVTVVGPCRLEGACPHGTDVGDRRRAPDNRYRRSSGLRPTTALPERPAVPWSPLCLRRKGMFVGTYVRTYAETVSEGLLLLDVFALGTRMFHECKRF